MPYNAFSPLNGGNLTTYNYASESPFDLDAGLDYTRLATGFSPFPFPVVLGWVNGNAPQANDLEISVMKGKNPSGPWAGTPQGDLLAAFPNIMGSMMKVSG
jgi:hypothetical protein